MGRPSGFQHGAATGGAFVYNPGIPRPSGADPGGDMAVEVGQSAPDFTLTSDGNEAVTLSSLQGKKTVLAFFPLAFTGG